MNTFKDKVSQLTEQQYRIDPAINYSLLKSLDIHPLITNEDNSVWNEGMQFGDLLDRSLFSPSSIKDKYYVSNWTCPIEDVKEIPYVEFCFNKLKGLTDKTSQIVVGKRL